MWSRSSPFLFATEVGFIPLTSPFPMLHAENPRDRRDDQEQDPGVETVVAEAAAEAGKLPILFMRRVPSSSRAAAMG
jgi:hypothetical protein